MNPHQQYPPYSYPQSTPGPPQPSWQAPPRRQGWGDPRLSQPQNTPPPASSYNPNTFGPISPQHQGIPSQPPHIPQYDTSTWGVKYNQTPQYNIQEQKPSLPPRPLSAAGNTATFDNSITGSSWQQPANQPSSTYAGIPQNLTSSWGYSQNNDAILSQAYGAPPPPPPRPPEYQAEIQAHIQAQQTSVPHDQYSQQPTTHHYDPQPQIGGWSGSAIPQRMSSMTASSLPLPPGTAPVESTVVSPVDHETNHWAGVDTFEPGFRPSSALGPSSITSPHNQFYSSALGPGAPSDWEHFGASDDAPGTPPISSPPPGHSELAGSGFEKKSESKPQIQPQPQPPLQGNTYSQMNVNPTQGAAKPLSQMQFQSQNDNYNPRFSVISAMETPKPEQQPSFQHDGHGPRNDSIVSLQETYRPDPHAQFHRENKRHDSNISALTIEDDPGLSSKDDSTNDVDGSIEGVIQAWTSPLRLSGNQDRSQDNRPTSKGSIKSVQSAPSAPRETIETIKIVDPYEDLEPEYRASLRRYAAMLRKEAAAETDEEKFEIFQAFTTKELRVRSMLYGIELPKPYRKDDPPVVVQQPPTPQTPLPAASLLAVKSAPVSAIPEPRPSTAAKDDLDTNPPTLSNQEAVNLQPVLTNHNVKSFVVDEPPSTSVSASAPVQSTTNSNTERMFTTEVANPVQVPAPAQAPIQSSISSDPPRSFGIDSSLQMASQTGPAIRPSTPPNRSPQDEYAEYSPGGRPRMGYGRQSPTPKPVINVSTTIPSGNHLVEESKTSPSDNAPMVLEDYAMGIPQTPIASSNRNQTLSKEQNQAFAPKPPSNVPNFGAAQTTNSATNTQNPTSSAKKFEPPRPVYTPFRYQEVQAPQAPADKSYTSLRNHVVDSGRLLVRDSIPSPTTSGNASPVLVGRQEHEEAFIGLIRHQSKAIRKKTPALPEIASLRIGTPRVGTPLPTQREEDFSPKIMSPKLQSPKDLDAATSGLRALLPSSIPSTNVSLENAKLNGVRTKLSSLPDQFGFIHDTVLVWDRANREVRRKLDAERDVRRSDNDARTESLFNDNEIGYADINELEAEFNLAEAEREYQENQAELESFITGVFKPVTERLQKEILELNAQYTIVIDMLDLESESASQAFLSNRPSMAAIMDVVLAVFTKLEARHQKVAEANVERERRRKRLEQTVLYTNGDTAGAKKLEKEFAVAENMQVLQEARNRDNRANKLVDSFDRATVRGLGDNQTFIDDLIVRIRKLKELIIVNSGDLPEHLYEPEGPRNTLKLAEEAINFVLADSQKLLITQDIADKLLNNADYEVSLAEAKVSNADQATRTNLEGDKKKEDAKIKEDTDTRLSSIAKAPEEALAMIREVIDKIGADPDHQDRIKKALEAAKQRNASTEAVI